MTWVQLTASFHQETKAFWVMELLNQVKEANKLKALINTFVYWRNMFSALPLFSFSCWMNCSKGRVRTLFSNYKQEKKEKITTPRCLGWFVPPCLCPAASQMTWCLKSSSGPTWRAWSTATTTSLLLRREQQRRRHILPKLACFPKRRTQDKTPALRLLMWM